MNNWPKFTIGELITQGVIEPPMDGNHGETHPKAKDYRPSGIPFIMASDINESLIDFKQCKFIDKTQADKLRKGFAYPGDVLLTHKATIGRTAIVPDNISVPYLMLTPQVTYYRVKDKNVLSNKYLKYYFDSPYFQKTLALWAGSGSTRAYLGILGQHNLEIVLPPLEIQEKISKILSLIDEKILSNLKINDILESMVINSYQQYLFNLKGNINLKYKKLKDITMLIRRGISPDYVDNEGMLVINQKCIRDHKISFDVAKRHSKVLNDERVLRLGDILVNSTGVGTLGRISYVKRLPEKKVTFDSHVKLIRADTTQILDEFLALGMLGYQPYLEASANGSTGQAELDSAILENLEIAVPHIEDQEKFINNIRPLIEKVALSETEIEHLVQIKERILPLLLSGKITFSN